MRDTQAELGRRFLDLHSGRKTFVLPNAWDVASARLFEHAGFAAIATTSAGIAFALGYPDGEIISREEMLDVVRRICDAVSVPVTADMEAGYGETPEGIAETARAVIEAGAVGMNFEDGAEAKPGSLADLNRQREAIQAVHEAAQRAGVPFVLNARTDIFWYEIGPAETRFSSAVERLNAYRSAGAQCLFAPGVKDFETIARLVKELDGPLNILATVGTPPVPELQRLGVTRVSLGSGPMRATMGLVRRIARELLASGTFSAITDGALPYPEANLLFDQRRR